MPDDLLGAGDEADDPTAAATAHLQRAAIEFIAAARILLDVAEEAVREPAGVINLMSETFGAVVSAVGATAGPKPAPSTGGGRSAPTVEHIRVT